MTRPPAISAAVVAVVVAVAVQATLLVFAQVSVAVAAAVAGLVLGWLDRPDAVRDIALPAAVIGLVATVAAMAVMAARGTAVLEGRFLVAWVVTAVIGTVIAAGVSWGVGRVTALAR
ncbi:hypothetical protein [Ornithinibacter aureus]|uniref:hypothetical protein n=1 Tax=Ornithinibacter aureus TaxID=622664 RepID=UPI001359AD6E|nr:hypothetical protein [Ornithinibacter aureus]KAF0834451.1 hypothetical protein C8E84_2275 [Ornithinibacter aureus]